MPTQPTTQQQELIDAIIQDMNNQTISQEDGMALLREADPEYPKESDLRPLESFQPTISTHRYQPTKETLAAQQESLPKQALRGALQGIEYLAQPGVFASEWLGEKLGVLPPLQSGELPEYRAVIGAFSDALAPPATPAGEWAGRAGEELGVGWPALIAARAKHRFRKELMDQVMSGAGAGFAKVATPSFVESLPGGQLASEVLGQGLGLVSSHGIRGAVRGGIHALPSMRESKLHSAFRQRMGEMVGDEQQSLEAIIRANQLSTDLPGFRPTLGAATGDPGLMALEEQARKSSPQLEAKMRQRIAESQQALAKRFEKVKAAVPDAPASAVTEAVVQQFDQFEKRKRQLLEQSKQAVYEVEARYAERLQSLDPISKEHIGGQIFQEIHASKQAWNQSVDTLYNTGPAASAKTKIVTVDELQQGLNDLAATIGREEMRDRKGSSVSFPTELVTHLRSFHLHPTTKAPTPVTFEELRGLRRVVGAAVDVAKAQPAPDRLLLGRLNVIQGLVEAQVEKAAHSATFSVKEIAALEEANRVYREGMEAFGTDPVVKLFRGGLHGEESRFPPSKISGMFLHGGKGVKEDIRALRTAVGNEKADALLRQDAIAQFQDLLNPDGSMPPARFQAFLRKHREAFDELPALRTQFQNLWSSQQAVTRAMAAGEALPKAIKPPVVLETEAAQLYMKHPIDIAVKRIADAPNARQLVQQTMALTRQDPMAAAGFRRAMFEELGKRMGITAPPGTLWVEHSATVAEVMEKHRDLFSILLPPQQYKTLKQIAEGEAILNRMPKDQRVHLERVIQDSGVSSAVGKFFSRMFAVLRHAVGETYILTEVTARRMVNALEGIDERKQRALMEEAIYHPDLLATFQQLVAAKRPPEQAKKKFHQYLLTLGLESRADILMEQEKQEKK